VEEPTRELPGVVSSLVGGIESYIFTAAGGDPDVWRRIRELPDGRRKGVKVASSDEQEDIFKQAEREGRPVKNPQPIQAKR
jgi:hypothetical protein